MGERDLLWPNFLDHWPLPLPLHLLLPRRLTPCGHNHRPPPVARHMRTAAPRRRSSTPLSLTLSLAPTSFKCRETKPSFGAKGMLSTGCACSHTAQLAVPPFCFCFCFCLFPNVPCCFVF